jgi:hypothetical protein
VLTEYKKNRDFFSIYFAKKIAMKSNNDSRKCFANSFRPVQIVLFVFIYSIWQGQFEPAGLGKLIEKQFSYSAISSHLKFGAEVKMIPIERTQRQSSQVGYFKAEHFCQFRGACQNCSSELFFLIVWKVNLDFFCHFLVLYDHKTTNCKKKKNDFRRPK